MVGDKAKLLAEDEAELSKGCPLRSKLVGRRRMLGLSELSTSDFVGSSDVWKKLDDTTFNASG